jgi:cytoskeletal protein CcmA (bactofilin family)
MWWEKKSQSVVLPSPKPASAPPLTPKMEISMTETTARPPSPPTPSPQQTFLGRTAVVRGQLSGDEDLLVEGQFEGAITLAEHCLTVGADGQVKAEIHARQVIILGTVTGNVSAREKIEIRRSGHVVGDLLAGAIAIEEGAYFKGSIDILREEVPEASRAVAAPSPLETSA